MYTNPHSLVLTLIDLLNRNSDQINRVVRGYEGNQKALTVFEGVRKVVPADLWPVLELEAQDSSSNWATTRAQRPRYTVKCTLTIKCSNEKYGHEYICTLATALTEIMTSPENLQLLVIGETKWDINQGLVATYILDSLVENTTYSAMKEGSVRKAEFNWFCMIHETYPESKWLIGDHTQPTILLPIVVPA